MTRGSGVRIWGDFDADGNVDLYVGFIDGTPNKLYHNDGNSRHFTDVAPSLGLNLLGITRQVSWIDYDNDGRPDLYVAGFLVNVTHYPDRLFHNGGASAAGTRFHDVLPALVNDHDASHGVQWVDCDNDGALDLALTNNDRGGGHYLFRNVLPTAQAGLSLAVDVVDARGRHTKPGAEVRVHAAGTRRLISSGLVDTGGGYCSQNVMRVHVATAGAARVDIEVTTMWKKGRQTTKRPGVDPKTAPRPFTLRIPD